MLCITAQQHIHEITMALFIYLFIIGFIAHTHAQVKFENTKDGSSNEVIRVAKGLYCTSGTFEGDFNLGVWQI